MQTKKLNFALMCIILVLQLLLTSCGSAPALNPGGDNTPDEPINEKSLTEDKDAAVTTLIYGDLRIQLLSDSLVRIEDKGEKGFENRVSYIVQNREHFGDKINYSKEESITAYRLVTSNYTVIIPKSGDASGVYITDGKETLYEYYGLTGTNVYLPAPSDEIKSWYFTDSPRIIPSDYGYSPVSSSEPLQGWDFGNDATDIFVFLPRGNYKTFAGDFVSLTGRSEMVGLKTLGYWDSRYYAYSEETALQQIKDYRDKGYAIDVLVVDTDWRDSSKGWGYDVNINLFPDMERFLKKAHELGVNICFNDHPEPVAGTGNLLDKAEVSYRNEKLTMLLAMGVDTWWYDRNWSSSLKSIDKNYSIYDTGMYAYQWITQEYLDSITDVGEYAKRALIMGNVDGNYNGSYLYASSLSAHRYSIQWTGDIASSSEWLQQEIEGAVMAGAELGLPYVSSDIGGHTGILNNNEYIRWFQYGALSDILRVHCTKGLEENGNGRMPWNYGSVAEEVAHTYQDMRYRLLPLFYSLAHENYKTGLPIMRRLDIDYPQYAESSANGQYLLGDYILVAPISEAAGRDKKNVFFPEGTWIDVWTGKRYSGPDTVELKYGITSSPIFVREGSLVALAENMADVDEKDWSNMALDVYPSANYAAKTTVYEDDSETVAYKSGKYRETNITMGCSGNTLKINIGAAQGDFSGDKAFTDRTWNIRLHSNPEWGAITAVKINGQAVSCNLLSATSYSAGGRPFAFVGAALDGDITTFKFNSKTSESYEIEIVYGSVAQSKKNINYDSTAVDFELFLSETDVTSVNLTESGTVDWISYGYTTGLNADTKKNGPALFSVPESVRKLLSKSDRSAFLTKEGPEKIYTDGKRKELNTVAGGTQNAVGYNFTAKTTGAEEMITVFLGGGECLAKLTVKDRAGNIKTVFFGGLDKKAFAQKVEIKCKRGEASTLYFNYSVVASKPNGLDTNSTLAMYCAFIN